MRKYLIIIIVLLSILVLWGLAYKFSLNDHEGYNSPIVKGTNYIIQTSLTPIRIISSIISPSSGGYRDTLFYDFNQKVTSKEQAISLIKGYLSEDKGFPTFNESRIYYSESEKTYEYTYGGPYDPTGIHGLTHVVLEKDGRLSEREYSMK